VSFRFGDFEIDIERRELRRAGAIVHIEPQVFDLLVHLIRNRDRVVGKEELIDTVWQGRIVSESTLSSRISAARRALNDSGNDQSVIRTLHKRGFRFVGAVEEETAAPAAPVIEKAQVGLGAARDAAKLVPFGESVSIAEGSSLAAAVLQKASLAPDREHDGDSLTVAPAVATTLADVASAAERQPALLNGGSRIASDRPDDSAAVKQRLAKTPILAAALVGSISLLISIAWWLQSSPSKSRAPGAQEATIQARASALPADAAAARPSSIIVVPFINLSGDPKQDYVADGVTDSLISDLPRALPGMSVVSRGTAFTYKGRGADARQIGRELGVRYLLSGSVAIEGERARVNIQLVETQGGKQLWAERFDTERRSILQVQDEIVSRVSRATGLKVVDIEARRSRRERPSSTELVDLVLRGKAALNLPSSPTTMIEARGLFEQALAVQPKDADALAGVASTLVFEFLNGYYGTGGDERVSKAEVLLDQAGAVEPHNLMVLKARAALRRAQGKFEDAMAAAQAIIVENPGEPWAYKEIGLSTLYLGRPEQALEWFAKADRIGPQDPGRWTWLDARGHALILLGRDQEAIHVLISALDANARNFSSHAFLAAAYALLGRFDDAQASLAAYLQRRPGVTVSSFRRFSPVPLALTSPAYQQQHERINEGLRKAGMPE
jgi:TolB-like protein/DNA-binding winged helix-turn-helix (wHTH) protein/Flp pilus assembly protein TadD